MKPKKLRPGPGTHSPGQYPTVPGMPHVSLPSHLPGAADLAQTQQALFHAHQQAYLQQVSPLQPQSHQVCVTNRCHKVKKWCHIYWCRFQNSIRGAFHQTNKNSFGEKL